MKLFDMNSIWSGIYLKPARTDLVLDAIVGLLLLVICGIVLGAFLFPACFPDTVEREQIGKLMQFAVAFGALYVLGTRYPPPIRRKIFDRNPPDNSERCHRINTRCVRIYAILCLLFLWESIKTAFTLTNVKWLDDILRFGFAMIAVSLITWVVIRVKVRK